MCELQNRLTSGARKAVGPPFLDTCGGVDYFHVLYALRRKGQGVDWRIVLPSDLHKQNIQDQGSAPSTAQAWGWLYRIVDKREPPMGGGGIKRSPDTQEA